MTRRTGWKYTYCASSQKWWQELRGGRWILVRGTIRSSLANRVLRQLYDRQKIVRNLIRESS